MQDKELKEIFENYQAVAEDFEVDQITYGHINKTYKIRNSNQSYILQILNTDIFKNLQAISDNISLLNSHLSKKDYPYQVLEALAFSDGNYLHNGNTRLFKFIEDSQTFLKVQSTEQANKAAKCLSYFHAALDDLETEKIIDSIPGFLDFNLRFEQYQTAKSHVSQERLEKAEDLIKYLDTQVSILDAWNKLLPKLPKRILHADPKISNFLFDAADENKIIALIDWDTLMLGPILYDFGDMVRSYTNMRDEDDPAKGNNFNLDYYKALEEGFLSVLGEKLTAEEKANLSLGAKAVIYIQALRFLTDYLNGDTYYSIQYENHNLDRTHSQVNLLKELINKL